jgi:hypothetical protein
MNKLLYLSVLLSFVFTSCVDELVDKMEMVEDITYQPTLAIPLVNGDYNIAELAEDLSGENFEIGTADDGTSTFIYTQPSVLSHKAGEYFSIDNQNYMMELRAGYDIPPGGDDRTIRVTKEFVKQFESTEEDKIYQISLKSGTLQLSMSGNIPSSGEVIIEFPSVEKDNETVSVSYSWDSADHQSYAQNIDLTGMLVDLSSGSNGFNEFPFNSNLVFYYDGNGISSSDGLLVDIHLVDLEFDLLKATFGSREIPTTPGSFDLNFIDEIFNGAFFLEETDMNFSITNSIGAPIAVDFGSLKGISSSGEDIYLSGSFLDTPLLIQYPDEVGGMETTEVLIDETNSNINEILCSLPNSIEYAFVGHVNPDNNTDIHFVADTSMVGASMFMEIPMFGYVENLIVYESYDFDGDIFNDLDNALIYISAENGLPLDAKIQAYFLDGDNNLMDSLFYETNHVFVAALVDEEGFVSSSSSSSVELMVGEERLEKISLAETVELRMLLNSSNSPEQSVHFTSNDRLSIQISGQTTMDL